VNCSIVNTGLQLIAVLRVLTPPEAKRFRLWRLGPIALLSLLLAGCGGGGKSLSSSTPTNGGNNPTTGSSPAPTTGNGLPNPTPVSVSAGQAATGVNVVVAQPASSPSPNAEDLGVNSVSGRGSASNTGGSIHRGSTMRVLLFGPGLNDGMKVIIAGPSDITITSVASIQATDNTPGIAFNAAVASNAALGTRTVYLQNPNGDMTSFTGGLEVIP
jgi:hypothetical protein